MNPLGSLVIPGGSLFLDVENSCSLLTRYAYYHSYIKRYTMTTKTTKTTTTNPNKNTMTTTPRKNTMTTKTRKTAKPVYSVIRCRNAGVHAGIVVSRKAGVLTLKDSRRLWRWASKATLSELATFGPVKPDENKYGCVLPLIYLTESDVCEVIPCTPEGTAGILGIPVWYAQ